MRMSFGRKEGERGRDGFPHSLSDMFLMNSSLEERKWEEEEEGEIPGAGDGVPCLNGLLCQCVVSQ